MKSLLKNPLPLVFTKPNVLTPSAVKDEFLIKVLRFIVSNFGVCTGNFIAMLLRVARPATENPKKITCWSRDQQERSCPTLTLQTVVLLTGICEGTAFKNRQPQYIHKS